MRYEIVIAVFLSLQWAYTRVQRKIDRLEE